MRLVRDENFSGGASVHLPKLKNLQSKWVQLPGNLRGAVWMSLAMFGLAGMSVAVKFLSQSMSVWEVLVLRAVFALLILSPALLRAGPRVWHTKRAGLHVLRSLFGFFGMFFMFLSLKHLDLTLVTTLGFARILFMILIAALLTTSRPPVTEKISHFGPAISIR